LLAHHAALDEALGALGEGKVEIDVDAPLSVLRAGTNELIEYGENGSALRTGIFAMGAAKQHKRILKGVRVNGSQPLSVEHLRLLEAHLSAQLELEAIQNAWGNRLSPIHGPSFSQRRAAYSEHNALLGRVLALDESLASVKRSLDDLRTVPRPERWDDPSDLEQIARGLSTELDNRRQAEVIRSIEEAYRQLGDDPHPVVTRLREAVNGRHVGDYREALRDLENQRHLASEAFADESWRPNCLTFRAFGRRCPHHAMKPGSKEWRASNGHGLGDTQTLPSAGCSIPRKRAD
jgi:hypothetical protein